MTRKYTMKIHAARVYAMLNRPKPCSGCPGQKHFQTNKPGRFESKPNHCLTPNTRTCKICRKFSGITKNYGCPCRLIGEQENIKRAWIKLEKMGMLNQKHDRSYRQKP